MKLGLFGLPKSGKTTLFNALAGADAPLASYSAKVEPNIAVVKVLDPRVDHLSSMYNPKKTIYASIELVDVAGITEEMIRQEAFSGELMRIIRNVDALAIVLRGFPDETGSAPDPEKEAQKIGEELLLADMIIVEKRLEKIREGRNKGKKGEQNPLEEPLLQRIVDRLNDNLPLRDLEFTQVELQIIKGFQLFSLKPSLLILNTDENRYLKDKQLLERLCSRFRTVEFAGNFEMELSRLSPEEARLFMDDMGIAESARSTLSRSAFDILGYISFFTVGPDEVRAWNIRKGSTAVTAAGSIHSDLARGFIAAECFSYEDLRELGSEKAVKEQGKFHLVGKDYLVQDGDILNIRFNV